MTWRHPAGALILAAITVTQLASGTFSASASSLLTAAPLAAASPCPSPASATSAPPSGAAPAANCRTAQDAALLNAVEKQLGKTMADLLRAESELEASLWVSAYEERQLASLITAANEKIAALDDDIRRLQAEIDATSARIEIERAQIAALARTIYSQPDSVLLVIMRSQSLRDAVDRTSLVVLASMRAQEIKTRLSEDLKRQRAEEEQVQADRDRQEGQRLALQDLVQRSLTLQSQALVVGDQLRTWLDQINAELLLVASESPSVAAEVQARIVMGTRTIIDEARRVTADHIRLLLELPEQARPQGVRASMLRPRGQGSLAWPLANAVMTQEFGPSSLALEPPYGIYPHFHTGIDLAVPPRSPVLAAADGLVVMAGWDPWGYGNYVVISHGSGLATLYGHLHMVTVAFGQTVTQGQPVGLEGSTGISTGPHLHFEVRLNGAPVNPIPYLVSTS